MGQWIQMTELWLVVYEIKFSLNKYADLTVVKLCKGIHFSKSRLETEHW